MKSFIVMLSKEAVVTLYQLKTDRRKGYIVAKLKGNRSRSPLSLALFILTTILMWVATGCQPPTPIPTPTPTPIAAVQPPVISEPKVGAPTPLKPGEEVGIAVDVTSVTGVNLAYTWHADGGEIVRGRGTTAITYRAPDEPGTYNVRVVVEWDGQSVEKATSVKVEEEPTLEPTEEPMAEPTEEPTSEPTEELTPAATPMPDAVVADAVNLRGGPGKEYDIIATLSPGQVLTVTGRITDTTWLQVSTDQMQKGWVINWTDFVSVTISLEQIPIVPTPIPPPSRCLITQPTDGDENLGYENEVRVTCSGVPDSLHVWVLVYSHHDHNYYLQPGPIGSGSGDYEGMAYLGTETEGAGHRFDIIVALADATVSEELQLPDGVEEKDRITVRRGQGCLITEPKDGDGELSYENKVRITCFDVPDSLHVWVLVYSHHDSYYYPQPGPIGNGSGQYMGMAYLGELDRGIGHRFDILVALANEAANAVLQSAAANHSGWTELPDGVEEMARITARRGH